MKRKEATAHKIKTCMHNSFSHNGAHLFNAVPDTIRNLTGHTGPLHEKVTQMVVYNTRRAPNTRTLQLNRQLTHHMEGWRQGWTAWPQRRPTSAASIIPWNYTTLTKVSEYINPKHTQNTTQHFKILTNKPITQLKTPYINQNHPPHTTTSSTHMHRPLKTPSTHQNHPHTLPRHSTHTHRPLKTLTSNLKHHKHLKIPLTALRTHPYIQIPLYTTLKICKIYLKTSNTHWKHPATLPNILKILQV